MTGKVSDETITGRVRIRHYPGAGDSEAAAKRIAGTQAPFLTELILVTDHVNDRRHRGKSNSRELLNSTALDVFIIISKLPDQRRDARGIVHVVLPNHHAW